ncbi:MAG: hypothetical protein J6125_00620, partial [Clostridia bacterium]|nr:hypothetical protein [Clostridia bacterium]
GTPMTDLSRIDPNFAVPTCARDGFGFYDACRAPFALPGLLYDGGRFRRMPADAARSVSPGVEALHANTTGGRLFFRTDSPRVFLRAHTDAVTLKPHYAYTGTAGFSMYTSVGGGPFVYDGTFIPPLPSEAGFDSALTTLTDGGERDVMICFPMFSDVLRLEIGLIEGATLTPPRHRYRLPAPVVYYGSSVTHGACSSRPGCAYPDLLSRALDIDYLNLGFSGSAKGEPPMAAYIASLSMSAFVLDYDYNAPTPAHLAATHEPFFRTVRAAHPDLPVLFLSRPVRTLNPENKLRCEIVRRTYERALADGDGHVAFLSGPELMALAGEDGTVDTRHPTDAGFLSMARAVEPVLRRLLGL